MVVARIAVSASAPSARGLFFPLAAWIAWLASLGWAGEIAASAIPAALPCPLFEKTLELNLVQEPELDRRQMRAALEALAERARLALAGAVTPRDKVAALNKTLLAERKVSYLSNEYWRDATLAASLLRAKGNCLSTSTLYVVVAERLGLPIRLVMIPSHAFVRWDDGTIRINIETTSGGAEISDTQYLHRMAQPAPEDIEKLGWGRSLDTPGFLAVLHWIAAGHRQGENRLEEALKLLEEAQRLAPNRSDLGLHRIQLFADLTGNRSEARERIGALLQKGDLPPSVECGAYHFLAADASGAGNHLLERKYLLRAFARAPKAQEDAVLQQLAFCHRALRDFRGAARYMELALALQDPNDPQLAHFLYNLAILQKNDQRLGDALQSIRLARQINPEVWNLKMLEAGYLVLNGQREEGLQRFGEIPRPRGDLEFYENMLAWFHAVCKERQKFYLQFEKALGLAKTTRVLEWIDQDVDLDVYRDESEFKALVERHAARLRGK